MNLSRRATGHLKRLLNWLAVDAKNCHGSRLRARFKAENGDIEADDAIC